MMAKRSDRAGTLIPVVLVGLICLSCLPDGQASPAERRLLKDLFQDYNKKERPVANSSDAVPVNFGVSLMKIFNLDEEAELLSSYMWLTLEWTDRNLRWNPEEYDGIDNIRLPPSEIWTPDIFPYNSMAYDQYTPQFNTMAVLRTNGSLTYIPPYKMVTSCKMDRESNNQTCDIKFGSWTYDAGKLDFQLLSEKGGDISNFIRNAEWDLLGMPAKRNVIFYSCCPSPYVDLTFSIQLARKPTSRSYIEADSATSGSE